MAIEQGFPVIIKDDLTGYEFPATMYECGKDAMFLNANYAPQPGSKFHIIFDHQEPDAESSTRPAIIKCRKLICESDSPWSYSLGIKYI